MVGGRPLGPVPLHNVANNLSNVVFSANNASQAVGTREGECANNRAEAIPRKGHGEFRCPKGLTTTQHATRTQRLETIQGLPRHLSRGTPIEGFRHSFATDGSGRQLHRYLQAPE
eukprot:5196162-Alexandrium_andersonii.AAC.1